MNLPSQRMVLTCLLLTGILLFGSVPAHAYIDPGTGSALIQGLIAAVAMAGIMLKLYWHRIRGLFGRKTDRDSKSSSDGDSGIQ